MDANLAYGLGLGVLVVAVIVAATVHGVIVLEDAKFTLARPSRLELRFLGIALLGALAVLAFAFSARASTLSVVLLGIALNVLVWILGRRWRAMLRASNLNPSASKRQAPF